MRSRIRYRTSLLAAAGICLSVIAAPVAAAVPECTNTGPNTTLCQSNGSAQIVTTPPANNFYPFWGFPIIGFGGIGIGFGW